jgi:hypothetical protein
VKIERDYGSGGVQVAYEYGYNSDGVRVWKRDVLAGQEYRYLCRIGCGGVPMRVYNRAMGGSSWVSVEDYLPAGSALGYNENWRYRYSGGELLMMGATGELSRYYPMDSNGLAVQSEPPVACVCYVAASPMVCAPLGYQNCQGETCDETPPVLPPLPGFPKPKFPPDVAVVLIRLPVYGNYCGPGHGCRGPIPPCPKPIDDLDACCRVHDNCYGVNGCDTLGGWCTCPCRQCDRDLCHCALSARCGTLLCFIARDIIAGYMCSLGYISVHVYE